MPRSGEAVHGTVAAPVTLVFSVYTMVGAVIYAKIMSRSADDAPVTEGTP